MTGGPTQKPRGGSDRRGGQGAGSRRGARGADNRVVDAVLVIAILGIFFFLGPLPGIAAAVIAAVVVIRTRRAEKGG